MDVTAKRLKVERIEAEERCHGPVLFRIRGACGHCGKPVIFGRMATLLHPESIPCPGCGGSNAYRFEAAYLEPHSGSLPELRRIEEVLYRRMDSARGGPVRQLGRNLLFPICAHLSNGFR